MSTQTEQQLEDNLVKQLTELGYESIHIANESQLLDNLKKQLEKHNHITLTPNEFQRVLNHLDKGNVFQRAAILRDRMHLQRDNGDDTYIEFFKLDHWCQNHFQVTRQVTMEGSYKNRYDVTLLFNGLPLVQIELKRRGLELKEAFNQTNRYQRHSYGAGTGLFQYIQIFVISNGVNTKYYANNRKQTYKQTFFWCDPENNAVTQLQAFTGQFLEPCHISKMIAKYTVLDQSEKKLMVLRSYQYYAVEALLDRVENSRKNGYIWHTTGSGKTLTSFKASQVLIKNPKVDKVVFVVDRKDLDFHTQKEFDAFRKGSVDATDNTAMLVRQFNDGTKLILTTIQKLNNAIHRRRYLRKMEAHKDEEIVFIFDECHRSQFGETHARIKDFFSRARMFGFTGTPIFADNAVKNARGKRTTRELFGECLHKYVITDAIRDENVLKFSIEYIGKYKKKEGSNTEIDIEVEAIDTKELLESEVRLGKITDYIIANHNRKTHGRDFNGMLCTGSIQALITYYRLFKEREKQGKHNFKIAAIFSYTANEEDKEADGIYNHPPANPRGLMAAASTNPTYGGKPVAGEPRTGDEADSTNQNLIPFSIDAHSRDQLESIIGDYNRMFGDKFTTKDSRSFYNYYQDLSKKVKNRRVDLLLVVNMFLTGFDAKSLNTLYVDKNLKHHGLIQAYSRTNRILNDKKSHGNIVCFRNLKEATDEAIALFANKEAEEIIIMAPYETYTGDFNNAYQHLLSITPTVDSVTRLQDEEQELAFIKAFRNLMRLKNQLCCFVDFTWDHLEMEEQLFEDYKSKYLDLYEKVKNDRAGEKVSILDDVDFELELIHRDEINVAYILGLLANLEETPAAEREVRKQQIIELLAGQVHLRPKRELIEKFIEENLPRIVDADEIPDRFSSFWTLEKERAFTAMCGDGELSPEKCRALLDRYLYTGKEPLRDDVLNIYSGPRPGVRDRKPLAQKILRKLKEFVDIFIEGIDV